MFGQGFKKKLGDWPRISNNRQMLADAAPGAATLQAPNQVRPLRPLPLQTLAHTFGGGNDPVFNQRFGLKKC